jgi:hypothetical protein
MGLLSRPIEPTRITKQGPCPTRTQPVGEAWRRSCGSGWDGTRRRTFHARAYHRVEDAAEIVLFAAASGTCEAQTRGYSDRADRPQASLHHLGARLAPDRALADGLLEGARTRARQASATHLAAKNVEPLEIPTLLRDPNSICECHRVNHTTHAHDWLNHCYKSICSPAEAQPQHHALSPTASWRSRSHRQIVEFRLGIPVSADGNLSATPPRFVADHTEIDSFRTRTVKDRTGREAFETPPKIAAPRKGRHSRGLLGQGASIDPDARGLGSMREG